MIPVKFHDYFERSSDTKKDAHVVLLTGDDPVLKQIIIEDLGRFVGLWELRERFNVNDVKSVVNLWGEGSLLGARFLDIRIEGTPENGKMWSPFLAKFPPRDNYMTVCFEGDAPDLGGILARPVFQVIECQFPKNLKARIKLITLRARTKGCKLDDEMIKELASRVKSSAELESALTTLTLLSRSGGGLTERDITYVAGESEQADNTSKAILTGNKVILMRQLGEMHPLQIMRKWHSTLKGLYCWMSQEETRDRPQEGFGGEEEGDDEEGDGPEGRPGLTPNHYLLKYYKIAQSKKYAQTLVRELMEDIDGVYQDIRVGKDGDWEERARVIISKIPT